MVDKPELLLALFGAGKNDESLDPISVMKGLFLIQMEKGPEPANRIQLDEQPFTFEAYSYGPFSKAVYSELDSLRAEGLLYTSQIAGKSYERWALTDLGEERAREVLAQHSADLRERSHHARQTVDRNTFDGLLQYVYSRYPDYATRSIYNKSR